MQPEDISQVAKLHLKFGEIIPCYRSISQVKKTGYIQKLNPLFYTVVP